MKKTAGVRVALCAAILGGLGSFGHPAYAGEAEEQARSEASRVEQDVGTIRTIVARAKAVRRTPEERLANGEILYRSKDYSRALVVFSEVLEEFPDTPSYPDALWLRGETYYSAREYFAARRDYRALVERGNEPRFAPYLSKALGRLVDVSLRLNDLSGLDEVFVKLNQIPAGQLDAGLQYAKGKAHYFKKNYGEASTALSAVGKDSTYAHQARYFEGLVAMRQAPAQPGPNAKGPLNYKQAIEAFKRATELSPDTEEHTHVIDLSWMAIGRLFYEMEQYSQSAEAYSRVGRESKEFDTMLYELGWVYVRLGDVQRAERALEVLAIADPSSPVLGEGTLLRADLLLRAGSFRKALQLYETVKEKYEPMRQKLDTFLDANADPQAFYAKLSDRDFDALDQNGDLPPVAVKWAREAEDGPLAFAVIDDVAQCKTLIKQSYDIIEKLMALAAAPNRVRAFTELMAGQTQALGLLNRVSRARYALAGELDAEEGNVSGELATVRERRRALMGTMKSVPVSAQDFTDRDQAGRKQWNVISQEVTRQAQETDRLHAVANGLRRVLKQDSDQGVVRDPSVVAKYREELEAIDLELKSRQKDIETLRKQIDFGRAQVGIGDSRFQADALARAQFKEALEREVALVQQGAGGGAAKAYGDKIAPTLLRLAAAESKALAAFTELESQVEARVTEFRNKVEGERIKITGYEERLKVLDGEAKDLVGRVARRNFELVRDKLRSLILRSDVGITEQAWEVREEEMYRVRTLQTERARQEQALDDELKEVLDDSGDKK